ncbi:MAG TPA: ornithine carbamoyltransferase [Ktedonobacterales bacterium]
MKHLVSLDDLDTEEIGQIFAHARHLKRTRAVPASVAPVLAGRHVALLFEKPSLRTRVSFEVAARELGAHTLYLSPQEVGLGTREAIKDIARVLSGYVHAVVLRTFRHELVEEFAHYASVPVINGLTDTHHPCQGLTDVFTIAEHYGSPAGRLLVYVGDGNNCAHSLIQAAAKTGMHIRIATPPGYEPHPDVIAAARHDAARTGGTIAVLHDPREAVGGADVVYTDVWTSMGQEDERAVRRSVFAPYQVDSALQALAAPGAIVLHPLPAHRGEEITDDVLDGSRSRAFVQAENRLHVQKAILRMLLVADAWASLSA